MPEFSFCVCVCVCDGEQANTEVLKMVNALKLLFFHDRGEKEREEGEVCPNIYEYAALLHRHAIISAERNDGTQ